MKLISVACISFLTGICLVQGQSSIEQNILAEVNPHWVQVTLTDDQSMLVRQCNTYTDKIQLHLKLVTSILIDRTYSMDIDESTRQKRLASLDSLTDYYERCIFPWNNKTTFSTPVFVDDLGTHCAVGYMLHTSGNDNIVSHIATENNLAYVPDLQHIYPELGDWAHKHGFTVQELAWIQPTYQFSCNPQLALGEIIHNTCYGQCSGGFYADHTTFNLPPGSVLSLGETFKWQNGQWTVIGEPDCLCPGLYRQEFGVYSMADDSMYSVFFEAEILGPDELWGYEETIGEAGLCRAYIVPVAQGGVPPYTFEVYDMEGNSYGLGPLCEGYYYLVTEDANGCIVEEMLQVYTIQEDCLAFSVTDMQLDDPVPGYLNVTLFLEGDSTSFITIPYYAEVINEEDNIVAWSANTLIQYGGTSQTYLFETTEVPLPTNSSVTLQLGFNLSFCEMPYQYTTSLTRDLQEFSMSLFPNPMQSETMLTFNEVLSNARLQIFNAHGQLVRSWTESGKEVITISRDNLPPGLYTIQVIAGAKTAIERFVVVD